MRKGAIKCIGLLVLFTTLFLSLNLSQNANAATASVSSAYVSFWSSSSQSGQVQATVNLPWEANIGGSASNRQSFYLNSIYMNYPISASSSATNIYGRLVMRFSPAFTDGETAYFCDKNMNDIHETVLNVSTACNATLVYHYSDNSTYTVSLPINFNYTLPSGSLAAYVDYSQPLPNVALTNITLTFAKTGNYDIYSTTNGYSLVLTTLVSDGSYYISDSGSGTDISPIINQNNTIINQNQQTIDYLTDDTPPSADTSSLSGSAGWLPAGPVDSILTLPVTFAQGIVNVFTGQHQCSPIVLPLAIGPYNYNLTIPCLDEYFRLSQISFLWNAVGTIISAFVIYETLKWLYRFVDETLSFRENNSGMWGGL